jgi:hypothetical protein
MSIALTEQPAAAPAEERRGGQRPDWDNVRPGEELPEQDSPGKVVLDTDDCGLDDRGIAPLRHWCGLSGCGGD